MNSSQNIYTKVLRRDVTMVQRHSTEMYYRDVRGAAEVYTTQSRDACGGGVRNTCRHLMSTGISYTDRCNAKMYHADRCRRKYVSCTEI
jgi:hypothetical protein